MSGRTASMMETIKAYALLRKTCLIHCATAADRVRLEGMMSDWPDYAKEFVTFRSMEESSFPPEPKDPPMAWFDECATMTSEQWELLRKGTEI